MLIAFSGAQSSGKSTLLEKCKELDELKGYFFVEEVTRRIKRENYVPINNDSDNYDYTQALIVSDHIKNMALKNAVLDRCALDGYIYTRYFYEENKVSRLLYNFAFDTYYYRAIQQYNIIFYTDPNIPLVDDGERSIDSDFRHRIVTLFENEIKMMRRTIETRNIKTSIVTLTGSVDERMELIRKTLKDAH